MTVEKTRELCDARPFRPFWLHLPDGRRIGVEHPDCVSLSRTGRLMFILHDDDSESIVDVLLVSDIKTQSPGQRLA